MRPGEVHAKAAAVTLSELKEGGWEWEWRSVRAQEAQAHALLAIWAALTAPKGDRLAEQPLPVSEPLSGTKAQQGGTDA